MRTYATLDLPTIPSQEAKLEAKKIPESERIPAREETGPGPDQFTTPVHAARVSNDDLV